MAHCVVPEAEAILDKEFPVLDKGFVRLVDYFGGDDALRNTKCRDEIKTQYCKENNIKLIRIPYWEFDNIEEILNRELEVV